MVANGDADGGHGVGVLGAGLLVWWLTGCRWGGCRRCRRGIGAPGPSWPCVGKRFGVGGGAGRGQHGHQGQRAQGKSTGLAVSWGGSVDDHDSHARNRAPKEKRPVKGRTVSTPLLNGGCLDHADACEPTSASAHRPRVVTALVLVQEPRSSRA